MGNERISHPIFWLTAPAAFGFLVPPPAIDIANHNHFCRCQYIDYGEQEVQLGRYTPNCFVQAHSLKTDHP